MRFWLLMAAMVAAFATPASARDWSGFYFGAQAGYGTTGFDGFEAFKEFFPSHLTMEDGSPGMSRGDFWSLMTDDCYCNEIDEDTDGFVLGGLLGFNWQSGNMVYGFEVGATRLDLGGTGVVTSMYPVDDEDMQVGDTVAYSIGGYEFSLGTVFTATGRIGYAFDRFLVSGFAGAAVARAEWKSFGVLTAFESDGWLDPLPDSSQAAMAAFEGGKEWVPGLVLGIGGEYAITDNVSLRLDYRHMRFFSFSPDGFTLGLLAEPVAFSPSKDFSVDLVTLGASFRF